MKITCDTCGSHYKIADEKVRGRRVKVKCKSCGKTLVVDGAAEAAAAAAARTASTAPEPGAVGPDSWTINLTESDQRTMSTTEIADGYRAGWISKDAYVWRDGMTDWAPIIEVPELKDAMGPSVTEPPALVSPAAQAPAPAFTAPAAGGGIAAAAAGGAARVSAKRGQRGADLFGGVANAGSEEEAQQAPLMAGTQAYDDPRPTGARNENSVLFSLDALKVGFGGGGGGGGGGGPIGAPTPAPAPPRGRPAPRNAVASSPDDPFGMGGTDSLAAIGGPTFNFGANQALLTAPAPPEPKPFFRPAPVVGDESTVLPPLQRRGPSKGVLVGAVIGILVVAGIVIASLGGSDEEELAQASVPTSEGVKASEKPPEEKKTEPKPEEKPEEKKAEENKPAETAKREPTEAEKKRYAEAQKSKSEAAEKPAAKPAEAKPQVKTQVSDGVSTFNKGAAIAALSSAASASSSCKRPGGPTGGGRAVVTFAPTGRVTSANITGGSFGGTSVGGCIASVFRRASVPSFSGSPVTVSKSFSISP